MKRVYFIGAGGIGMAALERYFLSRGMEVAGYDRTPSALTRALEAEGVAMSYVDSADTIPEAFRSPSPDTLVVYTPAVPADSAIMTYFSTGGFAPVKRAAALGHITRGSRAICFAGTHGKTTTSSMAAHVLHTASVGCNAFLGGIMLRYDSNLILSDTSPWTVVEADEYDRSFHQLRPYIAVITATDPDHLDIYGTEEAYLESFAHFTELIDPAGALVVREGLKLKPRPAAGGRVYTFGRDSGDFHAERIRRENGFITFDLVYPGGVIADIGLGVPVDINIDNAVAALAGCLLTGDVDPATARAAIGSRRGAPLPDTSARERPPGARGHRRLCPSPRRATPLHRLGARPLPRAPAHGGIPAPSVLAHTRLLRRVCLGPVAGRRCRAPRHLPGARGAYPRRHLPADTRPGDIALENPHFQRRFCRYAEKT